MLIGRDAERELLSALAADPPAVAWVGGQAGIGKSRLVREAIGTSERRVLLGRCHELREPFPLGCVIEALRDLDSEKVGRRLSAVAGTLRPLLPELSSHLPVRPDRLDDPRAERHRIFRALRELIGALGECVVVLEDLQWADGQTLEFLVFLVAEPPEALALILTYRDGQPELATALRRVRSHVRAGVSSTQIELDPLAPGEGRAVAAGLLAAEVPPHLEGRLHEWTAGIPCAIEEVLRDLRERGLMDPAAGRWPTEADGTPAVPSAVRDMLLGPMRSSTPEGARTVRAAAVLALPSDETLIRAVAGLSPRQGAAGIDEGLSRTLLHEPAEGLYGCRNRLTARALYEHIPGTERRRLHLIAARVLEARAQPGLLAEVARHYRLAGGRRAWLRAAEMAADAASSIGDDAMAAQILEQVAGTPSLPRETRRRMALKLGDAALFGRTPRTAISVIETTLADGSLPAGARGELRLALGRLLLSEGDLAGAERELARASDELRRRPALAARTLAILAGMPTDNEPAHRAWLDAALRSAARQDDPSIMTEVLATRAAFLLQRADPAGRGAIDDLPWGTTSISERLTLVRASKYLALAALTVGHHREAEVVLGRGDRIRCELDHGRFAVGLAAVRAWLELRTGRWEGLEARALQIIDASADAPGLSVGAELTVAFLLMAGGRTREATERFEPILGNACDGRLHLVAATVTGALARIHIARRDFAEAHRLLATGLVGVREHGLWAAASPAACDAVDTLVACGRPGEAMEVVAELANVVRGTDAPAARAALAHSRAALAEAEGRNDAAARSFASAERAWRCLPAPYEAARARERRGRCLLATGQRDAAGCLVGALEEFHRLGASWDADALRGELRAHGDIELPQPWRPGRKPYGHALSPRETEVAGLAANGRRNREIAAELFISERTAEKHVASVLRKLGLGSRQGIARALAQRGGSGGQ